MYLIYFDETGNTGNNLSGSQQPIFVLAALLVPQQTWQPLERDLAATIDRFFPAPRPDSFEIHASAIRNGEGYFRRFPLDHRLAFRNDWFAIARRHDLKVIYRAIVKKQYQRWLLDHFGSGVQINPHVMAFPLVALVVDRYLQSTAGTPLGIFVLDENKEIVKDVEKSIRVLRGIEGTLKLNRIIEKGFFIDSSKSLPLQLCDLCVYALRKKEEANAGLPIKPPDQSGIDALDPLIVRGNERLQDVIQWIMTS